VRHSVIAMIGVALAFGDASAAAGQAARVAPNDRAAAQARIRDRVARLLRERVGLSDDQLRRLAPVSRSYDERRRSLFHEERAARRALRRELGAGSADQTRVAGYIDQLLAFQRRRLDLQGEEQRELAAFMTPVQRARYLALQEHLRRRTEEMRRRRGNGQPRDGGRRGAPGGPPSF
jgi:Spy/CpxP family protein refolding chaperone